MHRWEPVFIESLGDIYTFISFNILSQALGQTFLFQLQKTKVFALRCSVNR